jgi:hypothetical protein
MTNESSCSDPRGELSGSNATGLAATPSPKALSGVPWEFHRVCERMYLLSDSRFGASISGATEDGGSGIGKMSFTGLKSQAAGMENWFSKAKVEVTDNGVVKFSVR